MKNRINLLEKEKTTKQNRIWIRIASACNNKCIFCLDSDAQNGTFPQEDIIRNQIKTWYKIGYDNRVIISGGEASINPKFSWYIQYAKEIGYSRVQTVTNGNMFFSENFCKKVFDAWLDEVTFSFHGHNSTLHDYLVATPWAFKKSLKALIFIKKYYPHIIVNIDIVVNKFNVLYLDEIVKFFMKIGVYEYDILQIIPFGRWFQENKESLFYDLQSNIQILQKTWELSKIPGMYMWTNRFPPEAFEGYEDLIQDPRKIKSEVMGESYEMFAPFIQSKGKIKPQCYWDACNYCFQKQFCHNFITHSHIEKINGLNEYEVINWEEFPSQVFEKYGFTIWEFQEKLRNFRKPLINIPKCLWGTGIFTSHLVYDDETYTLDGYTKRYISDFYRKKSLRCDSCVYNKNCQWIHINFIRSYGFKILQPIQ